MSDDDIKAELQELIIQMANNTEALKHSQEQQIETRRLAKRADINSFVAAVTVLFVLLAMGGIAYVVGQNRANSVTNCENANNTRAVQRDLWNGVLDAPNDDPQTEDEQELRTAFRVYVNEAFKDRDCNDLNRKYPEVEFPDLSKD